MKAKIESIAKNPLNKNGIKENKLNISSKTLKDSFSYLEEFKQSLKEELNIKKVETNYLENEKIINRAKNNNNNTSSLRTKESSCNINGINEYSVNGETGFSYGPEDVDGFADGIEYLADHPDWCESVGRKNIERAEKYDYHYANSIMKELYESM